MLPNIDLLKRAICEPQSLDQLKPAQWDLVIRQGRYADLLARIGAGAALQNCSERIPSQPGMHIQSALNLATRQQRELRGEVAQIALALAPTGIAFVLLKGAAYVMADLHAAQGRLMSDVDILVPHAALAAIESALMQAGWISSAKSDYDQRYYRTWMHELPPMRHVRRGTVIDVHHAILPTSARLHPSSEKLLSSAVSLHPGSLVKVLSPIDMVLHSATHLFHEGDLEQGLRGLVDINALLAQFSAQDQFWLQLVPRAIELELSRPLFYALRYAALLLDTPVPVDVTQTLTNTAGGRRPGLMLVWMDALFLRALCPPHASCSDWLTPFARQLLYARGHWLRMPPWLLLRHLIRKAFQPVKIAEV